MSIGPSFTAEITAAGLLGLPFSWDAHGAIEFGPTMTQEQRDAVLAVLAAHNGPLSKARHNNLAALKREAQARIAAEFGRLPDSLELIYQELNEIAAVWALTQKNSEGQALDAKEGALIAAALQKWTKVRAIRSAESAAASALAAATNVQEVDLVTAAWPAMAKVQ